MHVSPSTDSGAAPWRTGRLLAAVAVAAVLVLGAGAGAAQAHDVLVGSVPAAGAVVASAPSDVAIEFSDVPQPLGTQVVVTGPDGAPVSDGDTEQDGTTIRRPLAGKLPAGAYTVQWRATSADGHPLSGTFGFAVARGAATPAAAGGPVSGPVDTAGTTAAPGGSSFPVLWVAVGAILAVGAGLVVRQLRRPA
jgi:methionine-rich copper-binding protein CopC